VGVSRVREVEHREWFRRRPCRGGGDYAGFRRSLAPSSGKPTVQTGTAEAAVHHTGTGKAAAGETGAAKGAMEKAINPHFYIFWNRSSFFARNIPMEFGETRPMTPASSKASLAAVSPKLRDAVTLPLGIPHFLERFLLTSRIRSSPLCCRQ
jgi:hypothetical protein